ncbi:SpoIIE family protein phosphatase [Streptomyces sp. NBC_00102]|uniref:ATP-binding SpoIIE family protein phosphatase n=1 Tax=Streptomyces sp. NBC_00102 TaxID=2975652 RepID=UPI00224F3A20|nr:SpoIIE family protein phosphatase [Streptomyces sp. NBC_00102]MCX5396961.1 SpoIIE family protein phosphatase [Streptomyces sp. NBC_00102]
MGPIPLQRATIHRPGDTDAGGADGPPLVSTTSLPATPQSPSGARRFVRAVLAEWAGFGVPAAVGFSDRLADDLVNVASELVTNAVVHAGTVVDVLVRLEHATGEEPAAVVLEVTDHHPARATGESSGEREPATVVKALPGAGSATPPTATTPTVTVTTAPATPAPAPAATTAAPAEPPAAGVPTGDPYGLAEYGRGLDLVAALSVAWGITYRTGHKTVWARLPVDDWAAPAQARADVPVEHRKGEAPAGPATGHPVHVPPQPSADLLVPAAPPGKRDDSVWDHQGALAFLAEASDLLTGQLDEELVATIAGRMLVPRLVDWCAIWLDEEGSGAPGAPRLTRVRHGEDSGAGPLGGALENEPFRLPGGAGPGSVPLPWPPGGREPGAHDGAALACTITAGGRTFGTVLVGRDHDSGAELPEAVVRVVEDFVRRLGQAVGAARAYTRQATISRILQRGLLPNKVADIPGMSSALVYEPSDDGVVGGDFYDIFPCPEGRWCFVLGDVQGSGPEAAVVTGLARPWLRLLSREGFGVGEVLDRLNRLLLDDAMEAAEAAALMVAAAGGQQLTDGGQSRFLSLLYGEVVPLPGGGARCTVASAGHPLPLLLSPDGTVRPVAEPQVLLGVVEDVAYESQTFDLEPGDSLLCVTDGVTERRSGSALFDDGDGLARALAPCAGQSAREVAECIRRAVHGFSDTPPDDDVALLVLRAD